MRLRNRLVTPPGGWRYVDADTGFSFDAHYPSLRDLLNHVRTYREMNKLPRVSQHEVEAWLCSQPDMKRYCHDPAPRRTAKQYLSGAKAAARIALGSSEETFCSQKEAEARASLCVNCPHNRGSSNSLLRKASDKYVKSVVGPRRTSLDSRLYTCTVCSCVLASKVHISQKIVESSLGRQEQGQLHLAIVGLDGRQFYCWQTHPVLPS